MRFFLSVVNQVNNIRRCFASCRAPSPYENESDMGSKYSVSDTFKYKLIWMGNKGGRWCPVFAKPIMIEFWTKHLGSPNHSNICCIAIVCHVFLRSCMKHILFTLFFTPAPINQKHDIVVLGMVHSSSKSLWSFTHSLLNCYQCSFIEFTEISALQILLTLCPILCL